MTKSKYDTHAASFDGYFITMYCFDKKLIDAENFVMLNLKAYQIAAKRKYKIFKTYESLFLEDKIAISLN